LEHSGSERIPLRQATRPLILRCSRPTVACRPTMPELFESASVVGSAGDRPELADTTEIAGRRRSQSPSAP
jgi:hypothetical protein